MTWLRRWQGESYAIFFFFNDTATTEIYTLSLHDALPISEPGLPWVTPGSGEIMMWPVSVCHQVSTTGQRSPPITFQYHSHAFGLIGSPTVPSSRSEERSRSEEHTSELQSRQYIVCRLLLEKKKNDYNEIAT